MTANIIEKVEHQKRNEIYLRSFEKKWNDVKNCFACDDVLVFSPYSLILSSNNLFTCASSATDSSGCLTLM